VDGERPYYAPSVKADHDSALSVLGLTPIETIETEIVTLLVT
jgi:hypothetical protein